MEKVHNLPSFRDRLMEASLTFFMDQVPNLFIGGSRRFGYSTAQSDLDLFMLADPIFIWKSLGSENGQPFLTRTMSATHREVQLNVLAGLVHVNIFNSKVSANQSIFNQLAEQHDRLEGALVHVPEVVDTIVKCRLLTPKSLRETGANLYRRLVRQILREEPVMAYDGGGIYG